jgi:hypothetical protein
MDDAYCGGGDNNEGLTSTAIPIQSSALKMIAAAIFMGDPRHILGLSYNVGTCQASGVSHPYILGQAFTHPFINLALLTTAIVCSASKRLPVPLCKQDPIVLRFSRPVLLQWTEQRR